MSSTSFQSTTTTNTSGGNTADTYVHNINHNIAPNPSQNANRNKQSKVKLPVVLIKLESATPLGETLISFLLKYAESSGGYDKSLGHGSKGSFLKNTLKYLFDVAGPLNL